ncbi:MAG: alanine--glyoxylate aminotransferase [Acidobacteria bacterium RIFCSPLOWO2_02_FULL_61_28]|nr:MAG: alanine--glyoxylate aminotransferase [Acidobacteria bacterium RIFCSPLOWO2_02_FULL_61_28]
MPVAFPAIAIPKRLLMGPGPSEVDPRVYRAMTQPVVGYLDGVFLQAMDEIHAMLRAVFSTQNVATFPLSGTGSAGMEASLINFIEPGDEVAVVVGGVFAARMCEMVGRCGGKLLRIDHRPGTTADPDQVRQAVRGKNLKVLAVVHSETSTGVLQPLEPLKEIAQEAGALLVVDTVSSLAGVPVQVDGWGVDVCYSGSQKCLACPPGLAPITVGERAREVLRGRQKPVQSWYLDLSMIEKYWGQERRYHHTPPVSMLYALHEALRIVLEEGLEAVWARHQQCHRAFVQGVEALGLRMFVADPAARACTVNTVHVPDGVDDARVRGHLTERFGIEIATGIGDLRGKIWRVGLMGRTATPELVVLLLNALESALTANGFACPRGAGVAAAEKMFATQPQ